MFVYLIEPLLGTIYNSSIDLSTCFRKRYPNPSDNLLAYQLYASFKSSIALLDSLTTLGFDIIGWLIVVWHYSILQGEKGCYPFFVFPATPFPFVS